jgi:tetratricopeptide (TPR) repeat protein
VIIRTMTTLRETVLIILVIVSLSLSAYTQERAVDWYNKAYGEQTSSHPNWDLVIGWYKKAIELKPDYAEAYYNLGTAYGETGLYDEAIVSLRKAIEIKTDYPEAHGNLGTAYLNRGQKYLAADHLYRAALLFLKQGDRDSALTAYDSMKRFIPNSELMPKLHRKLYPE